MAFIPFARPAGFVARVSIWQRVVERCPAHTAARTSPLEKEAKQGQNATSLSATHFASKRVVKYLKGFRSPRATMWSDFEQRVSIYQRSGPLLYTRAQLQLPCRLKMTRLDFDRVLNLAAKTTTTSLYSRSFRYVLPPNLLLQLQQSPQTTLLTPHHKPGSTTPERPKPQPSTLTPQNPKQAA